MTPAAADATIYTVPADETALVKWLQAYNTSPAAVTLSIGLRVPPSGVTQFLLSRSIPATSDLTLPLWWALQPGWLLRGVATSGTAIRLAIFGTELEGVAD